MQLRCNAQRSFGLLHLFSAYELINLFFAYSIQPECDFRYYLFSSKTIDFIPSESFRSYILISFNRCLNRFKQINRVKYRYSSNWLWVLKLIYIFFRKYFYNFNVGNILRLMLLLNDIPYFLLHIRKQKNFQKMSNEKFRS